MTTSTEIKKALKVAFPGVKFTCRTNCDVTVSWLMDLGCSVTVDAVNQIVQPFATYSSTWNEYSDYMTGTGFRVKCNPEYTQERQQWAIEYVLASYSDIGGHTGFHFVDLDGKYHHNAQEDYDYCLENGATSNLFDENGEDNVEKTWYYQDLNDNETPEIVEVIKTVEEIKEPEPVESNLVQFKKPAPSSTPAPQSSEDVFFIQIYEAWVKKLITQGELNKIKSFEDWYALASQVL